VIVLGGGSAGFLAAITLKSKHPNLAVLVLRSPGLGIIGVGESTTPAIPTHLFDYLAFDPAKFHRIAQPTWKIGIRFLWGPRPFFDYTFSLQLDWKWNALPKMNGFFCEDDFTYVDVSSSLMSHDKIFPRQENGDPFISRDFAYHIENEKFVAFLEGEAVGLGVEVLDDTVAEVEQDDHGITALRMVSGRVHTADLYVDCSGFRSVLLGGALGEPYLSFKSTLFTDRAIHAGWERTDEPIKPYTTAETMDGGWCWQIDHEHTIQRGYVYCSAFISDEQAEREFRAKNSKIQSTRKVHFPPGRYRNSWVKNVVAVGNSSGFVEPLESTSLGVICGACRLLADILLESDLRPNRTLRDHYNRAAERLWETIRYFLGIHYRFNTRLDTAFWRTCRAEVDLGTAQPLVEFYRENGPISFARLTVLDASDIFQMEGHLVLLLGQKVPHHGKYQPAAAELEIWNNIRAKNRKMALAAFTIPEALAAIRAPRWVWNPGFFRPVGAHLVTPYNQAPL